MIAVSIVHPPSPTRIGDALTDAMSRVDGCPGCVYNTEPPRAAIPLDAGWRCSYLCADCGHAWTTDWMDDPTYTDPTERPCRDCGCDPCDHNHPAIGGCSSCGDCDGWS